MERFVINDQSGTINRPVYGRYMCVSENFYVIKTDNDQFVKQKMVSTLAVPNIKNNSHEAL